VRIITAREHISPAVDVKRLKKCCLSSAVFGTGDDMVWIGIKENENVRSECEEDVGTYGEDGDSDTDW
jgi:hypothetical protein